MTVNRRNTLMDVAQAGIFGLIFLALAQLAITLIAGVFIGISNVIIWIVQKCQAYYRKKHGLEPIDYVKAVKDAQRQATQSGGESTQTQP